jgi:type VI protein secretion system component Hcp
MRRTQLYAARVRRPKAVAEELRQLPEKRSQPDERARAESPLSAGIMRLQHSIGNRAVQRLIVQRQPGRGGGGAEKEKSIPSVVATITLERAGKLEGTCQLAGHEGKVELSSLGLAPSRGPGRSTGRRGSEREETKRTQITFTKPSDKVSVELQKALLDGDRIVTAQFEFLRRNEGGEVEVRASFEFSNGLLTNLNFGTGSGGVPMDAGTIDFEEPASD